MFTNRAPRDTFDMIGLTDTAEVIAGGPFAEIDDAIVYAWFEGCKEYKIMRRSDNVTVHDSLWRKAA